MLKNQNKLDAARALCERALALAPDSTEALNNLANVLMVQGKLEGVPSLLQAGADTQT